MKKDIPATHDTGLAAKAETGPVSQGSVAELKEAVEDTAIEIHAREVFHGKAGFTPKEYDSYKAFLKQLIKLKEEMQRRELKLPPIEDLTGTQ